MDLLAAKVTELFPEVEKSERYINRQRSQRNRMSAIENSVVEDVSGDADANGNNNAANGNGTADDDGTEDLPIYRQYIYDRVSGNSYVPRVYRTKENHNTHFRAGVGDHYHDDQDDPTDCYHRPPHYLCFVPPCVRRCPGFMEQNAMCELMGRCGFHRFFKNRHVARRRIFFVGFFFNFCAWCLTIVAAMAFSRNYRILTHTSFSRGEATMPELNDDAVKITFNIGFRAIATEDPYDLIKGGDTEQVTTFGNYCENSRNDPIQAILTSELCGDCRDSSQSFVLSTVINIFIIARNMLSDVTRMYPGYDLNCSNFYGSLMATVSVCLGIYTLFAYANRCTGNFDATIPTEQLAGTMSAEFWEQISDLESVRIDFEWSEGPGYTCLVIATWLKIADAICNYIVPTPSITRSLEEQEEYERQFGTSMDDSHTIHTPKHLSMGEGRSDFENPEESQGDELSAVINSTGAALAVGSKNGKEGSVDTFTPTEDEAAATVLAAAAIVTGSSRMMTSSGSGSSTDDEFSQENMMAGALLRKSEGALDPVDETTAATTIATAASAPALLSTTTTTTATEKTVGFSSSTAIMELDDGNNTAPMSAIRKSQLASCADNEFPKVEKPKRTAHDRGLFGRSMKKQS